MSDDILFNTATQNRVNKSNMVAQLDQQMQADREQRKADAGKRVPAWGQQPTWLSANGTINPNEALEPPATPDPAADVKPAEDGMRPLEVDPAMDQWLSTAQDVQQKYDLSEQQMNDEDIGVKRREGSYSNQFLKPNSQMVMGYDVATGEQIYPDLPPSEKIEFGLRKIREAEMNLTDGADANGMTGAAALFQAGIENNMTPQDVERELSQLGIPKHQIRMAARAADEAQLEADLIGGYSEPANATELQQASAEMQAQEDIPVESLPTNQEWMGAAETIYTAENGQPPSSPEELSEWALETMSAFNWKLASYPGADARSMAYFSTQAYSMGGEYARALMTLIDMYDRVPTNMGIVGENLLNIVKDPTTLLGAGAFGSVASKAAQAVAKNRMKAWLQRTIAGSVTGAVEGAVYTAAEDAMRQSVEIASQADGKTDYDPVRGVQSAAIGAAAGTALGGSISYLSPYAVDYMKKTGRMMRDNYRNGQNMTPMRSQYGAVMPPASVPFAKPNNAAGGAKRVGTGLPKRKQQGQVVFDHGNPESMVIGIDKILSDPKLAKKHADTIRNYDNFRPSKNGLTDEEVIREFRDHIVDNLLYLHDKMDPALRDQAKQWYDGARRQVDTWTEKYGMEEQQVAAVIANLSPQKDWFQNMSLAERAMDVWTEQQNTVASPEMTAKVKRVFETDEQGKPKKMTPANKAMVSAWEKYGEGKTLAQIEAETPADKVDVISAMFVRAYDEANNPRHHRVMAPDGTMHDYATSGTTGERLGTGWNSYGEIGKAVAAMRDPDLTKISERLGTAHKVRNFYNNIVSPQSNLGEVTIDTHAVAAGLIKPLAGASYEVTHNFGGTPTKGMTDIPPGVKRAGAGGSEAKGISGTYGIFADAYREAARQRGILPREMQSITWEEIRTIFTPEFKSNTANQDAINSLWREYKSGKMSLDETRKQIEELANVSEGRVPAWANRPDSGDTERGATSTYREELSGGGVPRSESQGAYAGSGSDAAGKRSSGSGGVTRLDESGADVAVSALGESKFAEDVARHSENISEMPEYADFVIGDLENKLDSIGSYTGSAKIEIASDLIALDVAGGSVKPASIRKSVKIIADELSARSKSFKAMEAAFLIDEISRNSGKDFVSRRLKQKDYEKLYQYLDDLRDEE